MKPEVDFFFFKRRDALPPPTGSHQERSQMKTEEGSLSKCAKNYSQLMVKTSRSNYFNYNKNIWIYVNIIEYIKRQLRYWVTDDKIDLMVFKKNNIDK